MGVKDSRIIGGGGAGRDWDRSPRCHLCGVGGQKTAATTAAADLTAVISTAAALAALCIPPSELHFWIMIQPVGQIQPSEPCHPIHGTPGGVGNSWERWAEARPIEFWGMEHYWGHSDSGTHSSLWFNTAAACPVTSEGPDPTCKVPRSLNLSWGSKQVWHPWLKGSAWHHIVPSTPVVLNAF